MYIYSKKHREILNMDCIPCMWQDGAYIRYTSGDESYSMWFGDGDEVRKIIQMITTAMKSKKKYLEIP